MERLLTIPVRCTVVFAIAALVGTSCLRVMRHLDAPPDQILAQKVVRPSSSPVASVDAETIRSLPGELFIPFVMAGLLLFSWQALDFSKVRKQSKSNNLSDRPGSRRTPCYPKVRR